MAVVEVAGSWPRSAEPRLAGWSSEGRTKQFEGKNRSMSKAPCVASRDNSSFTRLQTLPHGRHILGIECKGVLSYGV